MNYMSLEQYTRAEAIEGKHREKHKGFCRDKIRGEWYNEVIRDGNQMRLIVDDSELAQRIFTRYNDTEGLTLMINNSTLGDQERSVAQMILDSIVSSEESKQYWKAPNPHPADRPLVGKPLKGRSDVVRRGQPIST